MQCEGDRYIIYPNGSVFCVSCPECPPGMQPETPCVRNVVYNESMDLACVFCKK